MPDAGAGPTFAEHVCDDAMKSEPVTVRVEPAITVEGSTLMTAGLAVTVTAVLAVVANSFSTLCITGSLGLLLIVTSTPTADPVDVVGPITTSICVVETMVQEDAAAPEEGELPIFALHVRPVLAMKFDPVRMMVLPRYAAAGLTLGAVNAGFTV
jgi:hypothetical protein